MGVIAKPARLTSTCIQLYDVGSTWLNQKRKCGVLEINLSSSLSESGEEEKGLAVECDDNKWHFWFLRNS